MPDNRKQLIETPFGSYEIGAMQISDTYRDILHRLLEEEAGRTDIPVTEFDKNAAIIVRTWDRMRK